VLTCFNTAAANRESVRTAHDRSVGRRRELLSDPIWHEHAYRQVRVNSVLPFCNNTGDFAFPEFTQIQFSEWEALAEGEQSIDDSDEVSSLENQVALIFARALDTLVDEGAFDKLQLASPTLLGFGFHDADQYILRMLHLPE